MDWAWPRAKSYHEIQFYDFTTFRFNSCQVYFNLGVLQVKIDELVDKRVSEVRAKMNELLDVQRIVAVANEPAPGSIFSISFS